MKRENLYLVLVAVLAALLVGAVIVGGVEYRRAEQLSRRVAIPAEAPTAWSLLTGEFAYISEVSDAKFKEVYQGQYKGLGHVQKDGLIVICTIGAPLDPVDGSSRESWCISWLWNGAEWGVDDFYLWGTQNQYNDWKAQNAATE